MEILCPQCQRRLHVPQNLAGKNAKCPSCQSAFTIPAAQQKEPMSDMELLQQQVTGGGRQPEASSNAVDSLAQMAGSYQAPAPRAPSLPPRQPLRSPSGTSPMLRFLMPAGLALAVIGVFCPWYSVASSSHSVYGGASMAASVSGWWTIPGILTGVVSVPGVIMGLFNKKTLMAIASVVALVVALLGVWGIFYAPSATSSADFGGYGSAHGRAGFGWGVFVTMAGGALAAVAGILSIRAFPKR
jgi:hypothetical protein